MPWWAWALAAAAVAAAVAGFARQAADEYFRRHPTRIGRWSDVLPGWKSPPCARCRTRFAYSPAHEFRYEGYKGTRAVPVTILALCEACHHELPPSGRAPYYIAAWAWLNQDGGYDRREEISIRAAVEVGA